jgi:hypothetical protein
MRRQLTGARRCGGSPCRRTACQLAFQAANFLSRVCAVDCMIWYLNVCVHRLSVQLRGSVLHVQATADLGVHVEAKVMASRPEPRTFRPPDVTGGWPADVSSIIRVAWLLGDWLPDAGGGIRRLAIYAPSARWRWPATTSALRSPTDPSLTLMTPAHRATPWPPSGRACRNPQ